MLLRRAGLTALAGLSCYKNVVENCRRQHCQLTRARNAYLRPPISTPAHHCASAFT